MSALRFSQGPILRLILGDQLNPLHPWFQKPEPDVIYTLMEVRQETDYVLHHAQKVLGIFAAMRAFARHLQAQGHQVHYISIADPENQHSFTANLEYLISRHKARAVEYLLPDEWRVDRQLRAWAEDAHVPVRAEDTGHFYLPREGVSEVLGEHAWWVMEHLYRSQRRRFGVLMEGDKPVGGRWNYDSENRKPWKGTPPPPKDTRPRHDLGALWREIEAAGIKTAGDPAADDFRWPITREEALRQLHHFIREGLPYFGPFQDALTAQHERLFHSMLSFPLNLKMLSPQEVVQTAEAAYCRGLAPLASVEGFIRQILGWREYVRGVYWAYMPHYTAQNALSHHRPLPSWYWTGQTRMACLRHTITQVLRTGYAHHIQRLMVTGNFALLIGAHPAEVHRWYLGLFVDGFEWVTAPNTLGMSQWADGGLMATKPYISTAAYIQRMGDYCRGCLYDPKARSGENACPFNALYWDFLGRHKAHLRKNPRMTTALRQLERLGTETQKALQTQAETTLQRADQL